MFNDGIKINGVHSYYDYGLTINTRTIAPPPKRSIRKTVPFMNGYYDYTKLNGAVVFGERTLTYVFDIVGETVEEMDRKRTEVLNWLGNVHDADIYDDTLPEVHFHGSFETFSEAEDGEKTELTVNFICYPFKIANETREVLANGSAIVTVKNNGQPVFASVVSDDDVTVAVNGKMQRISAGKETVLAAKLEMGDNEVEFSKEGSGKTILKWVTEVL